MTRHSWNLVCKSSYAEKCLKELQESKTEENFARFINAAIHSERDSHVHQGLKMIRANIKSNCGNKSQLYYQLGVGFYRIGDAQGAKKALEDCLKADEASWEARYLLERVEILLSSESKLLRYLVVAGGLAVGVACAKMFSFKTMAETAGSLKNTAELADHIGKMLVTHQDCPTVGNKVGLAAAGVDAGIVGAAFLSALRKSSLDE